jgi:predicted nuclease of restriction endonuclease-like (RecB) superfamily
MAVKKSPRRPHRRDQGPPLVIQSKRSITDAAFAEIVELIAAARQRAVQAVNTTLIDLYWQVGAIISRKMEAAEWGDGVIPQLAAYLAKTQPGMRGFTPRNLFRMRQFFEAYRGHAIVPALPSQLPSPTGKRGGAAPQPEFADAPGQIVSALLRQLPWTHHLIILGQCKRPEEREFYLRLAVRERWSSRELERQLKGALFERTVLHPPKASQVVQQTHAEALSVFKDAYLVEFLDLPAEHAESDLHRGLLLKLKDFLIELGRDFCFVGSELSWEPWKGSQTLPRRAAQGKALLRPRKFPVQVGGRDFALDLLFFHRGLNCLVAIELKVGRFEPEYLGKLSFYLEALDRDVKKPHENPAIGVLLCASKDEEVVEYALSRTLSPALIAEYQPQLPDKQLLQAKLHEFYLQNAAEGGEA